MISQKLTHFLIQKFELLTNSRLLITLKKTVFMLHLIYMACHRRQYDIGFNRKKRMEVTNKMNTITLHHRKAAKYTIIEYVDKIWYSDSIITNQIILNSFKYAGISSKLDRSRDHQFRGNDDEEKESETIELENEGVLDQEDDFKASGRLDK